MICAGVSDKGRLFEGAKIRFFTELASPDGDANGKNADVSTELASAGGDAAMKMMRH